MDNIDSIIQLNRFSDIHDGKKIIFCKTDFLSKEFEHIKTLDNEVVLITGNSDYPITNATTDQSPKNIKQWYAENCLSDADFIEPIPLGIENKNKCHREGHGVGYHERVSEKEAILTRNKFDSKPTRGIYSNFTTRTNPAHRATIKDICTHSSFIEWEDANLSLKQFFDKILDYKMVVCPVGNGVDTHRLWEVLYSGRIPILIKVGNYKIYKLYEKLPIVILENIEDLYNEHLIYTKLESVKSKSLEYCDYRFWRNKIIKAGNLI